MTVTRSLGFNPKSVVLIVVSVVLSLIVGFYAQASAVSQEVYKNIFWQLLPFVLVNVALIAYLWRHRLTVLLLAAIPAFISLVSYSDLVCRVWFGIRII